MDKQEICAQFGLGNLIDVRDAGGTRNRTSVFSTDCGKWLVRRRYSGYSDPGRVTFDHEAAVFLCERGVPVVAPLRTSEGATCYLLDGEKWEVYPYVEGEPLRDGSPDDLRPLAEALARIHDAGRSFPLRFDKRGPRGETDPEGLLAGADRIEAGSPETRDCLASYREAIEQAAADLPLSAYSRLPHTLVHGDVQPANILMLDGRVNAFIDLDWVAWRPRIYDLAFALLCCCASHAEPVGKGDIWSLSQTPELDPAVLEQFLGLYQQHSAPLNDAEKRAFGPQTVLTWCHIRVDNALKAVAEDRISFLSKRSSLPPRSSGADRRSEAWIVEVIETLRATRTT
ncbi:MAG: phosphotransferase [Armatimonadota bacterium]|nr:phosphotransferase [Armatimonadota bacterium]